VRIGTKSVLFGAHCFFLHPWFVAWSWWTLYGFSRVYIGYQTGFPNTLRWRLGLRGGPVFASLWHPALWLAFFVHDIGYVGKPNMDGAEGERHPVWGARLMTRCFDGGESIHARARGGVMVGSGFPPDRPWLNLGTWGRFALLHSRYFSKSLGMQPSKLCIADKLAIALTPGWLYLPMVRATGEIREYMAHAKHRLVGNHQISAEERARLLSASQREWYTGVQSYCRRWAMEHRDGKVDTWTSDARNRATVNADGVWQ
jgi:hypothetical protein